jgi:hypothetical protein
MNTIVGNRYGTRLVLAKEPSALKPNGQISFARYLVRCEACGKEKVLSGQGVQRHACPCQKPKQTHCNRGHERIPENLIGNSSCCKLCVKQWHEDHPKETKEAARAYSHRRRLKNLYHLTQEQRDEMFRKQKGLCILPSCGKLATDTDHCHETERTRGLMCGNHNRALGLFANDPQLLREAAEYLEKFNVELKLHGTAARGSG